MNNTGGGVLTYYFSNGIDALAACESFYDDNNFCDGFHDNASNKTLSTTAPVIGDKSGAVFIWEVQNCAQVADSLTVSNGYATYLGECMRSDSDAQALTTTDVAELSGYLLFAWTIGYCAGVLVKVLHKAVEAI